MEQVGLELIIVEKLNRKRVTITQWTSTGKDGAKDSDDHCFTNTLLQYEPIREMEQPRGNYLKQHK